MTERSSAFFVLTEPLAQRRCLTQWDSAFKLAKATIKHAFGTPLELQTKMTRAYTVVSAVILMALNFIGSASASEPDHVVSEYISSFKNKDKDKMLACLADTFFAEHKRQYLKTVEGYPKDKQAAVLQMFEIDSLDRLKTMSGREIFTSFLEKPASNSYWKGFDVIDLVVDVKLIEKKAQQAVVKSVLSINGGSGAKVETMYSLALVDGLWKIERFQKKLMEPK
jgi:hypothetical protein